MGGKKLLRKKILPIILKDRTEGQCYVEPFIGGASVFMCVGNPRIGSDVHPPLIRLHNAIQAGWVPPNDFEFISKETYLDIKNNPENYTPELVAYVGFATSNIGVYYSGYSYDVPSKCHKNGIYSISNLTYNSLAKHKIDLKGAKILLSDYRDLDIPNNCIIYCDPPYAGTTGYNKNLFDNDKFWQWVRDKVQEGHKVFVSEYVAPDDFICVFEKPMRRKALYGKEVSIRVEKLFIHESQV